MTVGQGRDCRECGSAEFFIGEGRNARDAVIYPHVCKRCGWVSDQYASRAQANAYIAEFGPLVRVQTKSERMRVAGKAGPTPAMTKPCEVCGAIGDSQEHHWAPWFLFGPEAERWPTSWLCQPCHTRWHQVVTPNMALPSDPRP